MHLPFYEHQNNNFTINETNIESFPLHMQSHIEIFWVLEGEREMFIDGKNYKINTGDCAVIYPNIIHGYSNNTGKSVKAVMLIISGNYAGKQQNLLYKYRPCKPVIEKKHVHEDAKYALNALLKENNPGDNLISAFFQLFLARCIPFLEIEKISIEHSHNEIQMALRYILEEYQNPISLESVAEDLNLSQYSLSRLFTQKLNISFTEYVQALRVEKAKELLIYDFNIAIVDIAYECGFETLRNFNRVFLKLTGKTPSDFRKENKL